jgi:hypothetical protein
VDSYLAGYDGNKAGAEFQKILDRRGLNGLSVFLPLSPWNLVRAYEVEGDTIRQRRHGPRAYSVNSKVSVQRMRDDVMASFFFLISSL